MSLVFRENAKNRQNHGVFEGSVMGVDNFSGSLFLIKRISQTAGFISKKYIHVSIIQNHEFINIQSQRVIFLQFDGLTSASPVRPLSYYFF